MLPSLSPERPVLLFQICSGDRWEVGCGQHLGTGWRFSPSPLTFPLLILVLLPFPPSLPPSLYAEWSSPNPSPTNIIPNIFFLFIFFLFIFYFFIFFFIFLNIFTLITGNRIGWKSICFQIWERSQKMRLLPPPDLTAGSHSLASDLPPFWVNSWEVAILFYHQSDLTAGRTGCIMLRYLICHHLT